MLDYTGLDLDIEFPDKSGNLVAGRDLIDISELDIANVDKGNITSDEQNILAVWQFLDRQQKHHGVDSK